MVNRRRRRESNSSKSDSIDEQPKVKKEKKDVKKYLRDDETGELIPLTKSGRPDMRCNNARKYIEKLSTSNSSLNLSQNSSFNDSIVEIKHIVHQDGSTNQSAPEHSSSDKNHNPDLSRLNNSTPTTSSVPSSSQSSSLSLFKKPFPVLTAQHNISKIDVYPQSISNLVNEKSKRREQQQQKQKENDVQPSQEPTTTRNAISTQTETPQPTPSQTTSTLIQTETVEPPSNQTTSALTQTESISSQTASTSMCIQTDDLTLSQQESAGVQTDPGPRMTHVETQYQGRTHSDVSTQTVVNVFTTATQTQTPTFTTNGELRYNENNCCIF